jgi:hypothetical protein
MTRCPSQDWDRHIRELDAAADAEMAKNARRCRLAIKLLRILESAACDEEQEADIRRAIDALAELQRDLEG